MCEYYVILKYSILVYTHITSIRCRRDKQEGTITLHVIICTYRACLPILVHSSSGLDPKRRMAKLNEDWARHFRLRVTPAVF
jgi:hypothetical protein